MDSTSVVAVAARLRAALTDADPSLTVLRGDNAAVLVACLSAHLGGLTRRRPVPEFLELLAADLDELRGLGFELNRTPQEYLSEWVRQRYLLRRPGEGREETVELTPAASNAVSYAAGLADRGNRVTASRLANVADLLGRLARDSDADGAARLAALQEERARIDEQIRAVEAGQYLPVDEATALERFGEIIALAREIPGDFARVSADFDQLNHELRERIILSQGSRGQVLDEVFDSIDSIEASDAGRTFGAFYDLVLDPERSTAMDEAIAAVLERPFAESTRPESRQFLRRFLTALQLDAAQVRAAMTGFDRSLRQFVATRAYREQAQLSAELADAQVAALQAVAATGSLIGKVGYSLPTTSTAATGISAWRLHNPGDVRVEEPLRQAVSGAVDLVELRRKMRLSEIDFRELQEAAAAMVAGGQPATVGDVLAAHPATQGLASVIGLMVLAHSVGVAGAGVEAVGWRSASGAKRSVVINRQLFTTVPDDWSAETKKGSAGLSGAAVADTIEIEGEDHG
ncbi:MAG: DUF3375 domain-containing protein [Propionibacteriaceae bacterium]|jgi:hypothetical protein|nr:DUF3375 domain-containing protein [Propionibacteriaceae bacterium]